jgi:two-component system, NarL family, response regulator NreC
VIRVLIVDDHAVVRAGVRALLDREDDLEAVGEAGDAQAALRLVKQLEPDVVLMDVVMPGTTGVDAAAEIRHLLPDVRILMLSMQDDPSYVRQAFTNGAIGYVLKEAADAELVQAVRMATQGRTYLNPELGARMAAEPPPSGPPDDLTERELEVLRLIALGHTNSEIAAQLYLSVRTVESHRAHIQQKVRRSSRAELVRYALDHKLIEAGR